MPRASYNDVMLDQLHETSNPQSSTIRSAVPSRKAGSKKEASPASTGAAQQPEEALTRTSCVVEFRSGEAVIRHPELKCFLEAGWLIETAVPQLTDAQNVQLLVVLCKCGETHLEAADDDEGRPVS